MHRRTFMGTLGGIGVLTSFQPSPAATEKRTRFYLMEKFDLKQGAQPARMNRVLSQMLPALNRLHSGPKIFLESVIAPHNPQLIAIYGFQSLEELAQLHAKASQDKELTRAAEEEWEKDKEQSFEQQTNILLEATDYSPEIAAPAEPRKTPRIFELRVYHSPTYQQLKALHERFAGPELRIFRRVGVHPILYSSTIIGPSMPNLTYLIPFDDLAAREKAWAAFGADPEWVKVRKESIDKYGQISQTSQISIYRATAYSPIK